MSRAPFLRLQHKRKQDIEIKCPACDGSGECYHFTPTGTHKGYKIESSSCLRCKGKRYLKQKEQGNS